MAVCNFDMKFTDVVPGWEGSVHDSTLFKQCLRSGGIKVTDGKYFLGDAGFPNCNVCLVPYKRARYHIKEWTRSRQQPKNKEELSNLLHTKTINIIERFFGVFKNRFKLLRLPRRFKMINQAKVVSACCVLHNILVELREISAEEFENVQLEEVEGEEEVVGREDEVVFNLTKVEKQRAVRRRDRIARMMNVDYQDRRNRHQVE